MSTAKWRAPSLFMATALGEGGMGLLLLAWPPTLITLLLGVEQPSPEAAFLARIAGAALVALGLACWLGRNDPDRPAQKGLLVGVLTYDLAAAGILACTGWFSSLAGILLWPAVGFHVGLSGWCAVCLWAKPRGECGVTHTDLESVRNQ